MTQRIILVATDGTDRSRAILGRAQLIARSWNARIVLAYVKKPLRARFRLQIPGTTPKDLVADLTRHGGQPDDVYRLDGNPSAEIIALAARLQAALVVLGLHRERRVLDALRMTTLERITLGVDCPVLVAQTYPPRPYQRILGALSFDPICATGLDIAASLAPEADIQAIHALPLAAINTPTARANALQKADALRTAFMACANLPENMPAPEIVPGGVHEVLRYRMDEWKPDLLVIGSRSARDPSRLGNYARDLMRAPPTDVLVTRPG